ncbi:hypothetical protein D3C71_254760 [compost metagenome]
MVERFSVALDRVLGGGIQRAVRHGQKAQDGTDIEDTPATLGPHVRQHGQGHAQHAIEIRVEDGLRLCHAAFLCATRSHAETGVIHQQVDAAFALYQLGHGGNDGRIAGDVERQHRMAGCGHLSAAAAGAVHRVTRLRQALGRGRADAGRGAGDEGNLFHGNSFSG